MSTAEPEELPEPQATPTASEAMFRATFEHASVGLAHIGPKGQWLNVNQRASDIVGYSREELLKITFQDITHPDDLDLDVGLLNEVLEGKRETYRIEKRYFHKSGQIIWVLLSVSCMRNPDGAVAYFISVLQDITESKRLSQALADSETRFRAVQETNPDGFMMLRSLRNATGGIEDFIWEFINPAAEQLTSRAATGLTGKRLTQEMPETVSRGLFDRFCTTVETGQPWRRELYYPDNGHPRWFRFTVARVGDGFAVAFQDVTARKQAELKLHASEQRLRTILDGIVSMIGLANPDGTLLEINEASVRLTGALSEDLIGCPIWEHPAWSHTPALQDRLITAFAQAEAGSRMRFDAEIRDSRGRLIPVDVQLSPIVDETEKVTEIVLSAVDISERKRAEAHREMLLSELNHRVKNSLATVQAIAAHTLREAPTMDSFRGSFTGRLRAIAASHDLLVSTAQDSADISRLIRDQVTAYAPADESRLELSGPPLVLGPQGAHAFGLILHELATNASKYGAFSNETGRLRICWSIEENGEQPDALIDWIEMDGPPVTPPSRKGFGSALIEHSLSHALGGKSNLVFDPKGLKAQFRLPARK